MYNKTYSLSLGLYNKLLLRMAELYSRNTSNSEQLKPSKKTIRFLIDYSKSLKIIKLRKINYETFLN